MTPRTSWLDLGFQAGNSREPYKNKKLKNTRKRRAGAGLPQCNKQGPWAFAGQALAAWRLPWFDIIHDAFQTMVENQTKVQNSSNLVQIDIYLTVQKQDWFWQTKKLYFFETFHVKMVLQRKSGVVPGQAVLDCFLQVTQIYLVPWIVWLRSNDFLNNGNMNDQCCTKYPNSNLSLDGAADIMFAIGVTSTVVSMVSMLKKKKSS